MFTKKFFTGLLVVVTLLTACAPKATPAPAEPITLRMGIPDGDNVLYAPYVLEFIQQAKTLSNGTITIEPTWEAGDSTSAGYEVGVIQLVKDGTFDLGLAASRSFDSESINSFESLQAPFLIDNDALAKAVASSDAASRMLENLSSSGLAGLTLWPEDLRHPFSVDPSKPLLSPDDFQGLTIRVTDKGVGEMLMKALGGNPIFEASDYQGAESGLRQGATLTGRPAATGNVTFFAKYQVLFANGAAFEKLSDAQRAVLQEAAAAAQMKALAERPSDVDAGAAWCADGGSIVLASDEQVAAFQKAAQPVFDQLQENSFNAESIAAIRELKTKTQPSPSAQACVSALAIPTQVSTENQTWSEGLPPNGVWQVTLTNDDVINMGLSKANAPEWSGVYTFTFKDSVFHWTWEGTEEYAKGKTASADGTYEVVEDFVRLTSGDVVDDFQWRLDDEGLHFHLLATQNDPFTEIKAMFEAKPWQKVEDWSQGLLPNGVWQVKLSEDDIVRMGVLKSNAPQWAGTYTWTFQDGKAHLKAEVDITIECDGTYTIVKDFVRINYSDSKDCSGQDDIQWRLDADGLHFHLVATSGLFTENKAYLEAKPWQKVEEWSQGLLPNGVWQAELSVEDLVAVGGVMESSVRENAGVHTFTFQDGNFTWTLQGDSPGSCEGTYSLVGDINRLTATGGCAPEVDDIQWRLDDEGLHLHLVAIKNAPFEVVKASLEAKPYQKIADK